LTNTYEVLDLIISSIRKRFGQPGFETYSDLQNLLIKAENKECFEDELKATTSYGTDLESSTLQVQLQTLSHQFSLHESCKANLQDIINYIK